MKQSLLKVNDIFYTLQGEGGQAGKAMIFVRLQTCNLACSYCDTEFESGKEMAMDEILQECQKYPSCNILWTGGEPLLQLNQGHVDFFNDKSYYQSLETSGSLKYLLRGMRYITISPKVAEHVLSNNFQSIDSVEELRYPRKAGQGIPNPKLKAVNKFVSPIFTGQILDKENLDHCIGLVKDNPGWKLSLQSHKMIGIE